jgi:hypothetical protein
MMLWGWYRRKAGAGRPAKGPAMPLHPVGDRATAAFVATHRHRKGGVYRLLCYGTNEADRTAVAIYDDASGTVWVRPAAEFDDGRFEAL